MVDQNPQAPSSAKGLKMNLPLSLLLVAIAGGISPAALAGQRSGVLEVVEGQKARPDPVTLQPDFIFKACKETASTGDTNYLMNGIDPAGMLAVYLGNRSNRDILSNSTALAAIKTTLLEDAKHGEVIAGTRSYQYDPTEGYVGNDKAIFMAEFEGKRYKIIVELHVFDAAPMENMPSSCPPPQLIKVNGKPVSGFGASNYSKKRSDLFTPQNSGLKGLGSTNFCPIAPT